MNFEIRHALPEDANTLTQIAFAAKRHWNYPESWIRLWHPILTISPEYILEHETWVALAEGKRIAYYSLKQTDQYLWLDNLWVLPEYIGQGVGKILFDHALERCRVQGASILRIEADPYAMGFYERMGAHKIAEHRGEVYGQPRIIPILEMRL